MRSVTTSSRLTPDLYGLVVSLILLLVCHFIVKKIGLGHYIANDFFPCKTHFHGNALLKVTTIFLFCPAAVTLLSSYLSNTDSLLVCNCPDFIPQILFSLQGIRSAGWEGDRTSARDMHSRFCPFIVVGWGCRTIHSGKWQYSRPRGYLHPNLGAGFFACHPYAFVINRLVLASFLLGLALLLQAVNATNFAIVLGIAYLFSATPKNLLRLPLLGSPFLIFFAYQYYMVYGIPSFSLDQLYVRDIDEAISTADWYRYIYAQDPDDLSILISSAKAGSASDTYFSGLLGFSRQPSRKSRICSRYSNETRHGHHDCRLLYMRSALRLNISKRRSSF